jgi:hypothetical protein
MILTCSLSRPSARMLRNSIFELTGKRFLVSNTPVHAGPKLIRYGNCMDYPISTEFNNVDFIMLCCRKMQFSKLLLKNGFYTPEFFMDVTPKESDFPVMIRSTTTGAAGKGIKIAKNQDEFIAKARRGDVWTRFVALSSEFRVHVLGGKVAKVFKKIPDIGYVEDEFPIRTATHYHFSVVKDDEKFPVLRKSVANLTSIIKGGFYGLDVAWDANRKEYFFLEANSAPGLNSITVKMYAEFLVKEMEL